MKSDATSFNVEIELPVQWGDMDSFRHVNNTVYLRWIESSRIAYIDSFMNIQEDLIGTAPILAYLDCKYIFPITFPDTVLIQCKTERILDGKIYMLSHVFSKKHDRLAAIAHHTLVAFDTQLGKKVAIPEVWISGINKIENRIF